MPKDGTYRLSELRPDAFIRMACRKCDRKGQYRVAGLVERFGADYSIPSLLVSIPVGCPRIEAGLQWDQCGSYFVGGIEHLLR